MNIVYYKAVILKANVTIQSLSKDVLWRELWMHAARKVKVKQILVIQRGAGGGDNGLNVKIRWKKCREKYNGHS